MRDLWLRWKATCRRGRARTALEVEQARRDLDQAEYGLIWYRQQWLESKARCTQLETELQHMRNLFQSCGSVQRMAELHKANEQLQKDLAGALDEIERLNVIHADPWKGVRVPNAMPKEI